MALCFVCLIFSTIIATRTSLLHMCFYALACLLCMGTRHWHPCMLRPFPRNHQMVYMHNQLCLIQWTQDLMVLGVKVLLDEGNEDKFCLKAVSHQGNDKNKRENIGPVTKSMQLFKYCKALDTTILDGKIFPYLSKYFKSVMYMLHEELKYAKEFLLQHLHNLHQQNLECNDYI